MEVEIIELVEEGASCIYATYDPNEDVLKIYRETDEYGSFSFFLDSMIDMLIDYKYKIASLNRVSITIDPCSLTIYIEDPEIIERCDCPDVKVEKGNGYAYITKRYYCYPVDDEKIKQIRKDFDLIINRLAG